MSGGAVAESARAGKGKGGRRKKRRISILIDMTPMVDIVMLLLIFYMVTTVFAMPQAMEINLPPEEEKEPIPVRECKLLQIRVDQENRFFWNICNPADSLPQLIPSKNSPDDTTGYLVDSDSLRMILVSLNRNVEKLNTLVLIHRHAKYSTMVDILDEIDILERSWNAVTAERLGIEVADLRTAKYKDQKFSYRYAIGDWEDKDGRIVAEALRVAMGGGVADGETN